MPFKKNNPGCKCCTCVAPAGYVCVCSCLTPFLSTATVADGLGSHALTFASGPGFAFWAVDYIMPSVQTYDDDVANNCVPDLIVNLPVNYQLQALCATMQWRLRISWYGGPCRTNPGDPLTGHYFRNVPGSTPIFVEAFASLDCSNTSMITFSVPTQFHAGALWSMDTPGGGGSMTVVF